MPLLLVQLFGSILTFLGANAARVFTIETIKWLATKGLALFIIYIALPIVLYNVFSGLIIDFMQAGINCVTSNVSGYSPNTIALTGIGGWIASTIGLPSMIAQFLSAVSTRFAISMFFRRF